MKKRLMFEWDKIDSQAAPLMVSMKGVFVLKRLLEKVIFFMFSFFIFIILWKGITFVWDRYVPFNYKTDLLGLFIILPIMIIVSFILTALVYRIIRESN